MATTWSSLRTNFVGDIYNSSATNFDDNYDSYQEKWENRSTYLLAFLANHTISLIDALITGLFFSGDSKSISKKTISWDFNWGILPDNQISYNNKTNFNAFKYKLALSKNF